METREITIRVDAEAAKAYAAASAEEREKIDLLLSLRQPRSNRLCGRYPKQRKNGV
jgi:hypothetical protein